ncbi:MAG TPA: hypothetical protein VNL98_01610 [Gemmatimonadales bacterium]|nr:hypothetical protein [Gemmatimonadales bacterium]
MDAATLAQYRPLFLLLIGAALALGLAVLAVGKRSASEAEPAGDGRAPDVGEADAAAHWLMWVLAALACGTLVLLLFSTAIAFRFFTSWRVTLAASFAVLVGALPALAAWRSRT